MGPNSDEFEDLSNTVKDIIEDFPQEIAANPSLPGPSPSVKPSVRDIRDEAFIYSTSVFVLVAGVIVIGIAACVVIWWFRRKDWYNCYRKPQSIRYKQLLMNEPEDEKKLRSGESSPEKLSKTFTSRYTSSPTSPPQVSGLEITAGHLILSYIEDYLRNKNKLEEEWQGLETYISDDVSTEDALLRENQGKNRYPDSIPYDHTRVKLNPKNNLNGSDYINASFVYDTNPTKPEYIVSQGPLASTSADFWQMVWEQNISILVLLTQLNDRGVPQCYQYWPSPGSKMYGAFKVQLVSEHVFSVDYVIRSFYVQDTKRGGSRTVTQLHFLSWTSTGIPPHPTPLLQFRRKVHKAVNDNSPMLVHCSDGMGRSGTFCLIDMSIRRIGRAKEINLAATVEHLRDQRANMVKTKEQYEFALTALVEETQSLLRAMS